MFGSDSSAGRFEVQRAFYMGANNVVNAGEVIELDDGVFITEMFLAGRIKPADQRTARRLVVKPVEWKPANLAPEVRGNFINRW